MQRTRRLVGQVLPFATKAGTSNQSFLGPGLAPTFPRLQTDEEMAEVVPTGFDPLRAPPPVVDNTPLTPEMEAEKAKKMQELKESFVAAVKLRDQVNVEIEELAATGKPPEMSLFDLGLATKGQIAVPSKDELKKQLTEAHEAGRLEFAKEFPGPMMEIFGDIDKEVDLLHGMLLNEAQGMLMYIYGEWMQKYGTDGLASNIVVPYRISGGWGKDSFSMVDLRFILSNPEDCERISRKHVKKDPAFGGGALMDSVISTEDIDDWREQRNVLNEAFLPKASLARIMPVSLERAKFCAARLGELVENGESVDMNDFYLHETMAQLQMALLGNSTEEMEKTNRPVRNAFGGRDGKAKLGDLPKAMAHLMDNAMNNKTLRVPSDTMEGVKGTDTIVGPLGRSIGKDGHNFTHTANYGNALLILFAGHDTTGHTLTWLTFELARHPEMMKTLQKEVDDFFEYLDGRDPVYTDLPRLDFMNRCLTETLRLWPVVGNGTFRALHFPDTIMGPDGTEVDLPKGARCQIHTWARHMNPDLWGDDVNEFNPYRDFTPEELVNVGGPYAAVNPQSDRFSPFAFGPRSCLGKNFAQMEMRLILAYIFQVYDFSLAGPYKRFDIANDPSMKEIPVPRHPDDFRGINRGTMGPMDLTHPSEERIWGKRYNVGMHLHATARVKAREPAVAGVR